MIKNQLGVCISELVQQLRDSGKVVAPVPGTPLELLNNTVPYMECSEHADYAVHDIIGQSQHQAYSEEGKSHHCVELDAIVKSSARRVRALLDLARNFVNPMVEQVIEDINQEYSRRLEKVAVNLEVVTSAQNPLFKNSSIRDLASTRAKDIGTAVTGRPSYYSDFISDKINYLSTAVVGLEAELAMFFGQKGEEYLSNIFERFFRKDNVWELNVEDEDALAVLLFCYKLASDRDSENFIEGVGLGEVRESLERLSNLAANRLKSQFVKFDRREKNKRLIVSYPEPNQKLTNRGKTEPLQIVVEEELYKEFLETGGSPDLLCGAYITDQEREVSALIANQTKYIERWQRRVNSIRQTNEQAKFDILKRSIVNSLYKQLGDDVTQAEGVPFDRSDVMAKVTAYLAEVSPLVVNNPYPTILRIVTLFVFQNKHAERFLLDMQEINKHNPEIDMRHVAAQATLNYIINWVRSQLVIGN